MSGLKQKLQLTQEKLVTLTAQNVRLQNVPKPPPQVWSLYYEQLQYLRNYHFFFQVFCLLKKSVMKNIRISSLFVKEVSHEKD